MNATPPGHEFGRDFDAEALSRVLDGRALNPDASAAEQAAQARAEDDVDALRRAFALMGDVLAEDPPATAAAAVPISATDDEDDARGGAVVLPFAVRLRQRAPILAAAASLIAIVGFGAVLLGNNGFEGSNADSSPVAQAPAADAPAAAAPAAGAESYSGRDSSVLRADSAAPDAAAAPAEATAGEAAAAKAEKTASKSAPASTSGESSNEEKTETQKAPAPAKPAASSLEAAVACNRAVLVGTVSSITASDGRFRLQILVDEWISGGSGIGLRTFVVGEDYANTPNGREDLTVGRRFLFVVPQSTSKAVYAYEQANGQARQEIADARARQQNADC